MEDSRPLNTPMAIGDKLSKKNNYNDVNHIFYRSIIGKLQYVLHNKPDIALGVGIVTRFSTSPMKNYMKAIKRILRYLKGTK